MPRAVYASSMSGSMRLSAPPASTTSASPRAIMRNPSPTACVPATHAVTMVLFGPWQLNARLMCAAVMFGRCLSSHRGKSPPPSGCGRRVASNWSSWHARASIGASSPRSIGTTPVPITTPTRSGSSPLRFSPLSFTARAAAPSPNRAARPISFRFLRASAGSSGAGSKA